jgi:uncharacterized membrane protein
MSNRLERSYSKLVSAEMFADIAFVVGFSLLAAAVLLSDGVVDPVVQFGFVLPLFLFLPGYAVVAALYPEKDRSLSQTTERPGTGSTLIYGTVSPLERFAYSVGASIALVPLVGLAVNVAFGGLTAGSVTVSVSGITVVSAVVAGRRRAALRAEKRYRVPYRRWIALTVRPDDRAELLYNVVLVMSVIALVGSFTHATTVTDESFTEFAVLSESESGELVADGYPENLTRTGTETLYLEIANRERVDRNYTVVVELHQVSADRNETLRIQELRRMRLRVPDGETERVPHSITPTATGDRLRLTYLLYTGEPPESPRPVNAYRRVHIWVSVPE